MTCRLQLVMITSARPETRLDEDWWQQMLFICWDEDSYSNICCCVVLRFVWRTPLEMMTLICRVDFLLVQLLLESWQIELVQGVDEGVGPKLSARAFGATFWENDVYSKMNWWQADWNQLMFRWNIQPLMTPLCVIFLTMNFTLMAYEIWQMKW